MVEIFILFFTVKQPCNPPLPPPPQKTEAVLAREIEPEDEIPERVLKHSVGNEKPRQYSCKVKRTKTQKATKYNRRGMRNH